MPFVLLLRRILQEVWKSYKKYIEAQEWADTVNKHTKQDPVLVVSAVIMIIVPAILLMYGTALITDFAGILYPGYMTLIILDQGDKADAGAVKNWLAYWLITGFINLTSFAVCWLPYWTYLKAAFFVFLMAPNQNGPLVVYGLLEQHVLPLIPVLKKSD